MNTIIIIVDDLGWNDVGYNNSQMPTPNIDELAKNGIKFNNFYTSPVCTPTRASLLTGSFSYKLGLQTIVWPWNEGGLVLDKKLIPQYLKNTDSYIVGKWNLGHTLKKYQPQGRGFKNHYGNFTGCIDHYDHFYPLPAGGPKLHDFTENGEPIYPKGHSTDLLTNRAIEVIEKRDQNKEFFIYLAYNTPHVPLQAPTQYINKFNHIKDFNRKMYCAMVSHLDDSIGRLVKKLKEEKIFDDTLVWFTSDNGGWIGLGGDNGNLRGGKTNFYEGGVRVVNFLHCPKLGICKEDNSPRHVVDMLPTLVKLNSQEVEDSDLDGFDIFSDKPEREIVYGLYPVSNDNCYGSIRVGKYKLIRNQKDEIYDLEQDPFEKNNLANNEELRKKLVEVFLSKMKNYILGGNFSYHGTTGYPPNYKFPKWWGQKRNSKLKIMSEKLYFDENKDFIEILGYDVFNK